MTLHDANTHVTRGKEISTIRMTVVFSTIKDSCSIEKLRLFSFTFGHFVGNI